MKRIKSSAWLEGGKSEVQVKGNNNGSAKVLSVQMAWKCWDRRVEWCTAMYGETNTFRNPRRVIEINQLPIIHLPSKLDLYMILSCSWYIFSATFALVYFSLLTTHLGPCASANTWHFWYSLCQICLNGHQVCKNVHATTDFPYPWQLIRWG